MTNADLEDPRAQLDAFAAQPQREHNLPISTGAFCAPAERVFGAQPVAVHRDDARVLQRLKVLAAAAGENWYYRYPVKNKRKGTTDWIEGPSIKLANDLARIYGNSDIDVRVFDVGESWLIYARFIDLETGFSLTRPFQQQKGAGRIGGDDDARRLDVAFQIGVSKAIRNVVVNGLQTYADFAFEEARDALVNRVSGKLGEYRARVLQRLEELKVDPHRAELAIGRAMEDWLAQDVAKLIAMIKAVADGMANVSESFPVIEKQPADDHDPETGEVRPEIDVRQGTSRRAAYSVPPRQPEASTASGGSDNIDENGKSSADAKRDPVRGAEAMTEGLSGIDLGRDHNRSGLAARTGGATPPTGLTGTAEGGSKATKPADPSAEGEYVAHAEAWIGALTDPAAGFDRWKNEKKLRNRCNVSPDVRYRLDRLLQDKVAKIAELKEKDESDDVQEHDQNLATAAKSGGAVLEEAIARVPEQYRLILKQAIERRHRPAAAAVDAARAR